MRLAPACAVASAPTTAAAANARTIAGSGDRLPGRRHHILLDERATVGGGGVEANARRLRDERPRHDERERAVGALLQTGPGPHAAIGAVDEVHVERGARAA